MSNHKMTMNQLSHGAGLSPLKIPLKLIMKKEVLIGDTVSFQKLMRTDQLVMSRFPIKFMLLHLIFQDPEQLEDFILLCLDLREKLMRFF